MRSESPLLHHAPRRPRRRGDAVATGCSSGPATSASWAPASTRCCRSASGSASAWSRSSARRWTGSAARRWRCRWSTRPTSGARPAARTRSARRWRRFKDRGGRDMVLAMTHEEVVAQPAGATSSSLSPAADDGLPLPDEVARRATLPRWPHPGPRVRHEGRVQLRPRRGAASTSGYEEHYEAYIRIFERLGLRGDRRGIRRRDDGRQPGPRVHGPQHCRRGRPGAVREVRLLGQPPGREGPRFRSRPRPSPSRSRRSPRPARRRSPTSPRSWGSAPKRRRRRRSSSTGDGRLITAIVRGDMDVNETKLANAAGARAASGRRRSRRSRRPGWSRATARPIGANGAFVLVDDLVARSSNLVAGANREGFHYRNVNVGRDYTPDLVADVTNAREGDGCPTCGAPVILRNGIEVGNIFKLGTKYTNALGATYLGEDGMAHPIVMGSYGIGVGRSAGLRRGGAPRREGDRLAGRGGALRGPPRDRLGGQGPPRHRDRRAAPRPRARRRPRDDLGRPRRVAGRQVHRRRAAGDAAGS